MPIRRTLAVAASGAHQVPLAAFLNTRGITALARGLAASRSLSSQR